MSNKLGEVFQISIFGESHGEIMGVTISKIAPNIKLDINQIKKDLNKRRPKLLSESSRIEEDDFKIVSGYFNGKTTGAPLTILLFNKDKRSSDYDKIKDTFRVSHADYPAFIHSDGANDYRGGGIFSGRLTALYTIAGSIAKSMLKTKDIIIKTHIKEVNDIVDDSFDENIILEQIKQIEKNNLDVINADKEKLIVEKLNLVKNANDSIGSILESVVLNLEAGIGEPPFNKLDSSIARYLMNIPAIKGVSFGSGFNYIDYLGSEVLDEYYIKDNKVSTYQNHNGGIIGGLSVGVPITINTIIKPTPTINQSVRTINKNFNEVEVQVSGRHDSSIFTRASIIIDSMIALAIVDALSIRYGYMYFKGDK